MDAASIAKGLREKLAKLLESALGDLAKHETQQSAPFAPVVSTLAQWSDAQQPLAPIAAYLPPTVSALSATSAHHHAAPAPACAPLTSFIEDVQQAASGRKPQIPHSLAAAWIAAAKEVADLVGCKRKGHHGGHSASTRQKRRSKAGRGGHHR